MVQLKVNGKDELVQDSADISQILTSKGIAEDRVVVELNKSIVKREAFGTTVLADGDVLEIVHFVGGG